jgi:hypothetical protein
MLMIPVNGKAFEGEKRVQSCALCSFGITPSTGIHGATGRNPTMIKKKMFY